MAIKNPKKQFNFRVQIPQDPRLPVFSVQELTLPDYEIEQDEHGQGNVLIKTAGLIKISNATLSRIMPGLGQDVTTLSKYFWEWAMLAQNMLTGGGSATGLYKRTVLIHELMNDGITVANTFTLIDAWPSKINGRAYKRTESGNLVEEIELSTDYLVQLP